MTSDPDKNMNIGQFCKTQGFFVNIFRIHASFNVHMETVVNRLWFWVRVTSFSKPGAYITHDAMLPLSDMTGGNLLDYMQLSQELQKALFSRKPVNTF